MSIVDKDDLRKESEEATFEYYTSSGKVVRELFTNEFSGANWRKYSKEDMLNLMEKKISDLGLQSNDKHILLLRSSCKRAKTKEDLLKKMENFLLGGVQD